MTASISNTTQGICAICHEDYRKNEISNVTKVVELACHHFYHIDCIEKSLKHQESGQRDLTCCYCTQKIASPARGANVFANQEIFQERLEEIRGGYDYDSEVVEAISIVLSLHTSLHDLSNLFQVEGEEQGPGFSQAIGDLVIKNVEIKEDLKETVLRILAAMLTGDQALRSIDGEAKRWKSISFEDWPENIKGKGVLIQHKGVRMRISANHLKKVVDKISVDTLVDHYHKKANNFLQSARSWAPWILGGAVAAVVLAKKF